MTVEQYISGELMPFLGGAQVSLDMFLLSVDKDDIYGTDNEQEVNVALIKAIERLMYRPRLENINENGFSATINFDSLGKYYIYLCGVYGVTPNEQILGNSGLRVIKDCTNSW